MITQTAKAPIIPRTRSSVFIDRIHVRGSRVTADARVALCKTNLNLSGFLLLESFLERRRQPRLHIGRRGRCDLCHTNKIDGWTTLRQSTLNGLK